MSDIQGAWIWYELMTPDAEGSKAFYEKVVPGWTLTTSHGDSKDYGFITNADGGMTGGVGVGRNGIGSKTAAPGSVRRGTRLSYTSSR